LPAGIRIMVFGYYWFQPSFITLWCDLNLHQRGKE